MVTSTTLNIVFVVYFVYISIIYLYCTLSFDEYYVLDIVSMAAETVELIILSKLYLKLHVIHHALLCRIKSLVTMTSRKWGRFGRCTAVR